MPESPRVLSIFVGAGAGAPMAEVREVRAEPGKGLDGDRYFDKSGTYSKTPGSGREVTLIEAEALEAAARDEKVEMAAALTRRNLLVRGVYLNHLVDREFTVGGARLRGTRLCEPCDYLEKLTGVAGVKKALHHRGGLRCEIVEGGLIKTGDPVTV